ncbi:hypothetical protein AT3G17190 [Arabidopsis thaliana]|uniref:Uncharacterized protein n=1 Tax=Arabidopsis thaliana TaxID=3702 RepID=F4J412_ARATH|nr:uncharacterized protein AT3G17190 [Arabidopsis thaliana]AEE75916.1 hypothetical protein AT3G17190 [Arabidopsis thaliana]|eukprot:NP_188344.4 hypothetical protein AT3G17190 [Arabidopsis thaliana]
MVCSKSRRQEKLKWSVLTLSQDPKEGHIGRGIQQRDEKGKRKLGEINNLGASVLMMREGDYQARKSLKTKGTGGEPLAENDDPVNVSRSSDDEKEDHYQARKSSNDVKEDHYQARKSVKAKGKDIS